MDIMQSQTGTTMIGGGGGASGLAAFRGVDPATLLPLEPAFGEAGAAEIAQACARAEAAFDLYREMSIESRAGFLETIADNILDLGDALIDKACAESGLPRGRILGERGRTMGQLRMFAAFLRDGAWADLRIDPAQPARAPLPRPDLRLRNIPLGPVAVFGASNFPLAFSVAGGDTASALAAGCPVVVKAHPAHPGTSALAGQAIAAAVASCGLPPGVFSLLFGVGHALGAALVADPRIKAVGFTGSRAGGLALLRIAAQRAEPIPVYAEMSSINPVILLPAALAARAAELGKAFAGSLTMGAGQFCTNPGLVIAQTGPDLDRFIEAAAAALRASAPSVMLTEGIFQAYQRGVRRLAATEGVTQCAQGQPGGGVNRCEPRLFVASAETFLSDATLAEEIFGAASLIIACTDQAAIARILEHLEGQLTITLQMDAPDAAAARALRGVMERKAGRLLVNGWPTGVEVCHAMVHGGPYPATSDSRTSSVGTLAIRRFLRPVCYQDFPADLLPETLADANPAGWPRLFDGKSQ